MTGTEAGFWRRWLGRKGKPTVAAIVQTTPSRGVIGNSAIGVGREGIPATIYRQLLAADDGNPPDLLDSGPEGEYGWPKDLKFAPGAHDGITMRRMAPTTEAEADKFRQAFRPLMLDALAAVADRERFVQSLCRLQQFLAHQPMAKFIDTALAALVEERPSIEAGVLIGRALTIGTFDREVGKFGLGVLMATGDTDSIDLIRVFGKHEEFAPYVIAALKRCAADPIAEVWQLARHWTGWGRVHAVGYLSAVANERPDLQRWLLHDGWRGTVTESLPYDCAIGGGLVQALARDDLDDADLDDCCCILECLIDSSAMPSISEYAPATEALGALIRVLRKQCDSLLRASIVLGLQEWLSRAEDEASDAPPFDGDKAEVLAGCEAILASAPLILLVKQSVDRRSRDVVARAARLAEYADFDWWESGVAWLKEEPELESLAVELARTDDKSRAQRLLHIAEEASILSPPADDVKSVFPSFFDLRLRPYLDLAGRFDLKHDLLQKLALRSGWLSNKKWAVDRLARIPVDEWGPGTVESLRDAAIHEVDSELRASLTALVAKVDALLI